MKVCPTPWKVGYSSSVSAKIALMRLQRDDKDEHHEKRPYRCPCGRYHLTSKDSRDNKSKSRDKKGNDRGE